MVRAGAAAAFEARGQARLRKGLAGGVEVPRALPQPDTQSGGLSGAGPLWSLLRGTDKRQKHWVHNLRI